MKSALRENGSRHSTHPKQFVREKGRRNPVRDGIDTLVNGSPLMVAQRKKLQSLFGTAAQLQEEPAPKSNHTGLPDTLKSGIESLSGLSMDHVQVHYNSSKPAQLNALAYAQGSDIHVAPGQEQHLPHEAWHVMQQAQGRVQPTRQMAGGVAVNDDRGLEREAGAMGTRAQEMADRKTGGAKDQTIRGTGPIQRVPIGPNNLETTDLRNRGEILDYLRGIGPFQMETILNAMIAEKNPNNTEYIQICTKELKRDEGLREVGMRSREGGGIWTSATVFIDKQFWHRTFPKLSGSVDVSEDKYGSEGYYCNRDEKRLSSLDSEVGTLDELSAWLMPHIEHDWQQHSAWLERSRVNNSPGYQRRFFAPGQRLDILITGNVGPCDGCKQRLANFWGNLKKYLVPLQVNGTMEVNYQTRPSLTERSGHETMYGYDRDDSNTSPSGISYYIHTWS